MGRASKTTGWDHISSRVRSEDRGYSSPCWIWTGPLHEAGYGRTSVPGVGQRVRIHRLAYETFVGPIPEGLVIDHLCRVRACCNPAHLEAVTSAENIRRGIRSYAGRPWGVPCEHGNNRSACKPCRAAYMRAWYASHPEVARRKRPRSPEYKIIYNARRKEMRAAGLWTK
jgi:hypothetical protein